MEIEKLAHAPGAGKRVIIFAPNWLGDAVMALPAIDDVRRGAGAASVDITARGSIAPLFTLVPGIGDVVTIDRDGSRERNRIAQLRQRSYDVALLLPNSFQSALTAWRAGIGERWGYRAQGRGVLLTRAVRPTAERVHQAMSYQQLTQALGFEAGPLLPRLDVPAEARRAAAALLTEAGWDGQSGLVALAPGAAYGSAKRWPSESFAALAARLTADGLTVVLIGSATDAPAGAEVIKGTGVVSGRLGGQAGPAAFPGKNGASGEKKGTGVVNGAAGEKKGTGVVDLIGRTDLPTLAGILVQCRGLVSNDSGAMHLGAALGIGVTAVFGPTNERETRPIGRVEPVVLTHDVWCRPCMLRECPLTHRCLRGISVDAVLTSARRTL